MAEFDINKDDDSQRELAQGIGVDVREEQFHKRVRLSEEDKKDRADVRKQNAFQFYFYYTVYAVVFAGSVMLYLLNKPGDIKEFGHTVLVGCIGVVIGYLAKQAGIGETGEKG